MRHTALPPVVDAAVAALATDAHPMSVLLVGLNALGACHPEANPALAGQNVYNSREMQDKQVLCATCLSVLAEPPCIKQSHYLGHDNVFLAQSQLHQRPAVPVKTCSNSSGSSGSHSP